MAANASLEAIRKKLELSQEGLAKKLGVSFTTVNRWERGKAIPREKHLKQLQKMAVKSGISNGAVSKTIEKLNQKAFPAYAFFAGAGGLHLGLENAGFKFLVASDIEPSAESTHKRNWPNIPFICKDIRKISAKELIDAAGGTKPFLICGGPPCQGFSTLGDKLSSDPRNQLFDAYARLVAELDPKCILIENVKALVTMYHGQYSEYIVKKFSDLGYTMYRAVLNAADFGVPQIRYRVFFFGTKIKAPFAFPEPTHGKGKIPYLTVGDAIMDLSRKKANLVPNHLILDHSETVVSRYKLIPEGGKLPKPEFLPPELRRKNFGNTYKRLHRKKPSLTLVPGNNAFPIHPTLDRSLTPREAARLQTFPDTILFDGDRRRQCILVGNAVPPKLASVIGNTILKHAMNKIPKSDSVAPVHVISSERENIKMDSNTGIIPLKSIENMTDRNSFIDLFAGAGGFTIGFSRGGWKPLISVDNNEYVAQTHRENFPAIPFLKGNLSEKSVRDAIASDFGNREVGIIVGGPPCQGFSIFGKRRFVNTRGYEPESDPRNKLVYAYLDLVEKIKPRWFVMENVPGLANLDDGLFLKSLIQKFIKIGYPNTEYRVLCAADYGVPQLRNRLIIIGNKTGHIIPWPKKKFFETPKDWQDSYRTVGEVINDLSDDSAYEKFPNHKPMKHKPLLVERYKFIPEGGKLNVDALPAKLKKGYRTEEVKNYSHVFKRLHRDKPSFTMVPGHNAFPIHPWLHRALTVREAARIQTFPDNLVFMGPRQEQCIQVGNAFPPMLAEVIANNIKKAEVNNWFPGQVPSSASYSLLQRKEEDQTQMLLEEAAA